MDDASNNPTDVTMSATFILVVGHMVAFVRRGPAGLPDFLVRRCEG